MTEYLPSKRQCGVAQSFHGKRSIYQHMHRCAMFKLNVAQDIESCELRDDFKRTGRPTSRNLVATHTEELCLLSCGRCSGEFMKYVPWLEEGTCQ